MFYDKRIKYLNYIVEGERVKGCGFVKVELRDQILNLEVVVNGLPTSLYCGTDVWLCAKNDNYLLGKIYLENGRGTFRLSNCNFREICPTGIAYEDWNGISIIVQDGIEISGLWGEPCRCVLERVEVSKELAVESKSKSESEKLPDEEIMPVAVVSEQSKVQRESGRKEIVESTDESADVTGDLEERRQTRLAEEKWEQLWGIYPHIRPFRDKREYLSIRPADFVLLSELSYKAVNNSFLLHGYYNYQHLILARTVKKGQAAYYVGTPGNFFEREKQVAIMFGFTGFECSKDPAREGDFGYYLMEVQL